MLPTRQRGGFKALRAACRRPFLYKTKPTYSQPKQQQKSEHHQGQDDAKAKQPVLDAQRRNPPAFTRAVIATTISRTLGMAYTMTNVTRTIAQHKHHHYQHDPHQLHTAKQQRLS